jgi:hypothetical protein
MIRQLIFPPDFSDYAWEVESKGVFWGAAVRIDNSLIDVTFYEPTRLRQDIEADIEAGRLFTVKNLLVIEKVTIRNMQLAVSAAPEEFFE